MKRLLLRCDDFGCAEGANQAILTLARQGYPLNVSVLVCGPAVMPALRELAAFYPRVRLGIHSAITSEWDDLKWGPVSAASRDSALVDARGYFHPSNQKASEASPELVAAEVRAQIELAMGWGLPFSYLDEHMGFAWRPEVAARQAALAREFGLVYKPDLTHVPNPVEKLDDLSASWEQQFDLIKEECSLLITHPVLVDESTRRLSNKNSAPGRVAAERNREFQILSQPGWTDLLRRRNLELITYCDL